MATLIIVTGTTAAGKSRWIKAWLAEKPKERAVETNWIAAVQALTAGKDVAIEMPSVGASVKVIDVA